MATRPPWDERSGSDKRKLLGRFGIVYLAVALLGLAFGWMVVVVIFGLGALGLGIAWFLTPDESVDVEPPREKPDWMKRMDDPDAPDLTLPEYKTNPGGNTESTTPPVAESPDPPDVPPTPAS